MAAAWAGVQPSASLASMPTPASTAAEMRRRARPSSSGLKGCQVSATTCSTVRSSRVHAARCRVLTSRDSRRPFPVAVSSSSRAASTATRSSSLAHRFPVPRQCFIREGRGRILELTSKFKLSGGGGFEVAPAPAGVLCRLSETPPG